MGADDRTEADGFARRFDEALTALDLPRPPARWLVAFSGGLDSTLLLDALRGSGLRRPMLAIHVDHGLHEDSADWSAHCAAHADARGIDFRACRVTIERPPGQSLEAVARDARYQALTELVGTDDLLLTAHHADDQLETVLLRILRGTGVRGLASIRAITPFGAGWLARPLLGFTRAEIEREARRRGLDWLEDPSNRELTFDRNYLRAKCLPPVHERWPQAGVLATRLSRQMAEASDLLTEVAAEDLARIDDPQRIPADVLQAMPPARRNNLLRHAFGGAGLPLPNAAQLGEVCRMLTAREDAEAVVRWPGAEARLFRRQLYLLAPADPVLAPSDRVAPERPLSLGPGELRLERTDDYGIPERWAREGLRVAYRAGGERFRPYRSACRKTLKHWFQEADIVPWMRGTVPLLYRDEQLVAVADICLADGLPQSPADAPFWRPVWTGHARLY